MKAVIGAFNQEKVLDGSISMIVKSSFEALLDGVATKCRVFPELPGPML